MHLCLDFSWSEFFLEESQRIQEAELPLLPSYHCTNLDSVGALSRGCALN